MHRCKYVRTPVGADDPVRPRGTIEFADGFRENEMAYRTGGAEPLPYGMTGGAVGRADVVIGPYKRFACLHRCVQICHCILRADRVVRPYGAIRRVVETPAAAIYFFAAVCYTKRRNGGVVYGGIFAGLPGGYGGAGVGAV